MNTREKNVVYQTTNTYETLNQHTAKTKHVWIVLHGIGYLSKYFIRYFEALNAEENYIIAPQAPSKYYLKNEYKYVGASWLTKENTGIETQNVIAYLDAIYGAENIHSNTNLIVFGFSQGVSIACRWVAQKQLKCNQLVLYAGGIPNELKADDFTFFEGQNTKVKIIVGNKDEYLNEERMKLEIKKISTVFSNKAELLIFEGGHEVKKELLNNLI